MQCDSTVQGIQHSLYTIYPFKALYTKAGFHQFSANVRRRRWRHYCREKHTDACPGTIGAIGTVGLAAAGALHSKRHVNLCNAFHSKPTIFERFFDAKVSSS